MIKITTNFLLTIFILFATTSCSKDSSDLSFSSIMLGKEFPDSLIQSGFKYFDSEMPSYEGKISFNLPSSGNVKIDIVARVDRDTKKVCLISLSGLNMSQLNEFYNMLLHKYGKPATPYSDIKSPFSLLLSDSHRNIDKTPEYIQDEMTWVIWHPEGYESSIEISEYFYYQSKRNEPLIYITYKNNEAYKIATKKAQRIIESEEAQKEKNKREKFKKTHPFMNQDF